MSHLTNIALSGKGELGSLLKEIFDEQVKGRLVYNSNRANPKKHLPLPQSLDAQELARITKFKNKNGVVERIFHYNERIWSANKEHYEIVVAICITSGEEDELADLGIEEIAARKFKTCEGELTFGQLGKYLRIFSNDSFHNCIVGKDESQFLFPNKFKCVGNDLYEIDGISDIKEMKKYCWMMGMGHDKNAEVGYNCRMLGNRNFKWTYK